MSINIPLIYNTNIFSSFSTIPVVLHKAVKFIFYTALSPLGILNAAIQSFGVDLLSWKRYSFTHFSKEFIEELEKSNREKPKDAPFALLLQAEADHNGVFSTSAHRHILLQIAKTHRVALKMINSGWFFGGKIREAEQEHGGPIDLLYVSGHGDSDRIRFGEFGIWNFHPFLRIGDLEKPIFSSLANHAIIILDSCNAGKVLAPVLAATSERIVLASKFSFDPVDTIFHYSSTPRLLALGSENQPLMLSFSPSGGSQVLEENPETYQELFQDKLEYAKKIAKQGVPAEQQTLARFFGLGRGGEKSEAEALHWNRLAAENGEKQAQYMMGIYYKKGKGGVDPSEEEALSWFRLAAAQGHSAACYEMGRCYEMGLAGLSSSDKEALHWYLLAADHPVVQLILGIFHLKGRGGLAISEKEALKWFQLAADQEIDVAQFNIGIFYKNGLGGLSPSHEEALRWFRLAADQGFAEAQYEIGLAYQYGRGGLQPSNEEALRWFRLAADQGDPDAQLKVGVFYHWGRGGLEQSYVQALHWYRLAADQGDYGAQFNLGFLHEHGLGGLPPSDEEALRLYRLAAQQGSSIAKYMMGVFYEEGRGGISISQEESRQWFEQIPEDRRDEIRQEIENLKNQQNKNKQTK